ncbi:MAG TPA: hypothetical protein VNR00_09855 [Opitutus sp.]|nr:hypothetical protein [Opitutus sp.]
MSSVRTQVRLLPAALLLIGAGLPAHAADPLAVPSPFLPPGNVAGSASAPTPDAPLELRGIMAAGDDYMFSIYDPAHRTSTWLRLNETGREIVVTGFDQERDTVTVESQGRVLTLALKTAKVASAPATPPPVAAPAAPQPIGGPVVLNPTPADEQRRLEAIAAEVNRRRMIRQQALQNSRGAQQGNQPARPGPTQP